MISQESSPLVVNQCHFSNKALFTEISDFGSDHEARFESTHCYVCVWVQNGNHLYETFPHLILNPGNIVMSFVLTGLSGMCVNKSTLHE